MSPFICFENFFIWISDEFLSDENVRWTDWTENGDMNAYRTIESLLRWRLIECDI